MAFSAIVLAFCIKGFNMSAHATHASDETTENHGHGHALKLFPFFLALLALTAAEVGLYEWWRHSWEMVDGEKVFVIPKFALVLLVLVFTLPKAYIVLVYFMHIKFERAFIVWLAVIPLMMTFLAVLPTLTDTATLKPRKLNHTKVIGVYYPDHHDDHKDGKHDKAKEDEKTKAKAEEDADDYK